MKRIILFSMLIIFPVVCFVQNATVRAATQEQSGKQAYIPKNLDECFSELKNILKKEDFEQFKNRKEEDAVSNAHFAIGMWIRNNWGLWAHSRLAKYFNDLGIYHPDDMSGIILASFHRHLNNQDTRLEEQVKYYQEYWKYATVPKDTISPKDGGQIDFILSMPSKDGMSEHCRIHLGVGKTDGLPWAYQYGRGVFEPNEEQKKEVLENYKKLHST